MVYKIVNKEDILTASNEIKNYFINGGKFLVVRNYNNELTNDEIIEYYTELNKLIGKVQPVDLTKYTDNGISDVWVDVKYDINVESDKTRLCYF